MPKSLQTNTCEIWFSTQGDEERLLNFEVKISKKICRPVNNTGVEKFQRTNVAILQETNYTILLGQKILNRAEHFW